MAGRSLEAVGVTIFGDEFLAEQDELQATEATQEGSECRHHWVLVAPDEPVSKGGCRNCGEERDFSNYIDSHWSKSQHFGRSNTSR